MSLRNKKILIGISGSIAAYKSILLLRILVKHGAEIRVVMTNAAQEFVSPLVLSVLSKNKVSILLNENNAWNNHVEFGRWADVFVIAPLTCNTLSKMASGLCDNLLMSVYLSATCPVVVAPSMDEDMWKHPSTKRNLETIRGFGNSVIQVNNGELASGIFGEGRMAEPDEIVNYLIENIFRKSVLKGKKVLITAGPTYEAIDPVRFIGNRSSGKMGFALAYEFYLAGADVVLVTGPTHLNSYFKGITVVNVQTAEQMFNGCHNHLESDIVIMSAAVSDYTVSEVAENKIKKVSSEFCLQLQQTKDILSYFGSKKKSGQFLIGFALETENEWENAIIKLKKKNLDCIILNSLNDDGAGFEKDTNKVSIISSHGSIKLAKQSKVEIAKHILDYTLKHIL